MENPSPELALDFHNPWIRFWGAFQVIDPFTPKGVEHLRIMPLLPCFRVIDPFTPKGVEHDYQRQLPNVAGGD
jgi:hypothetical protein